MGEGLQCKLNLPLNHFPSTPGGVRLIKGTEGVRRKRKWGNRRMRPGERCRHGRSERGLSGRSQRAVW